MENNEVNLEMVRTVVAEEAAAAGIELSEQQLDELSKATLGRYVEKAAMSHAENSVKAAEHRRTADDLGRMSHGNSPEGKTAMGVAQNQARADARKATGTADKRAFGIHRAVKKLTKEDLETLVGHFVNEDAVSFADAFDSALRSVVNERIDELRPAVAASMFGTE